MGPGDQQAAAVGELLAPLELSLILRDLCFSRSQCDPNVNTNRIQTGKSLLAKCMPSFRPTPLTLSSPQVNRSHDVTHQMDTAVQHKRNSNKIFRHARCSFSIEYLVTSETSPPHTSSNQKREASFQKHWPYLAAKPTLSPPLRTHH